MPGFTLNIAADPGVKYYVFGAPYGVSGQITGTASFDGATQLQLPEQDVNYIIALQDPGQGCIMISTSAEGTHSTLLR